MSRKLSLDEIAERGILVPGQEYVAGYLRRARPDSPIGVYEHSAATDTCLEKIALLNKETSLQWVPHQAIKAPFFEQHAVSDKENCFLYCFVTPELGMHMDTRALAGFKMEMAAKLPEYMERGTCTPFIRPEDVSRCAGRVQRVYLHYEPALDHTLADISIGGRGSDAHRLSLWMKYGALRKLLQRHLGDVVIPCSFHYKEEGSKSFKPSQAEVQTYGR